MHSVVVTGCSTGIIALVVAGGFALLASIPAQSWTSTQSGEERLRVWTTAVQRHRPGQLDESVTSVARWPASMLGGALSDYLRLHDRNDLGTMRRLGVDSGAGRTVFLRRAALLHADVAILHRTADGYDLPASPRRSILVGDGSEMGEMGGTIHWEFARRILDALPPGDLSDGYVREWYRATAAWLQEGNEYAEFQPHLVRARQLFPEDPVFMMYLGTMHTAFAEPRIQNAMPEAPRQVMTRSPRDLAVTQAAAPIGNADFELDRAETWLRKALAQDKGFAEARIRLAYVLGRLGRHADAVEELQRALSLAPARLLEYYAQLLLGRALVLRKRVEPATAAFSRAAALYPSAQSPRLALSQLARDAGDRDRSVRELDALITPGPDVVREDPWWVFNWTHAPNAAEQLALVRQRFVQ